ncbi:MAG TPA: BatA domain-containing protein, partial [Pirellulales bacterium]|nr:BatA domain-containing protein [Pirellulales bacterium]
MGFLAPWFVAAGMAAIGLPIMFHLLRRTPRRRTPFSALMFLTPSPPRLTRRSRIENWPLLVLRGLVLALLALAFGRPFLRQWLERTPDAPPGERLVVLVDTSASMRRGDLWSRAVAAAQKATDVKPTDELAILSFANKTQPVVSFETWRATPVGERTGLARSSLATLEPGWSATRVDDALLRAVETLDAASKNDTTNDAARSGRIVLISDLQSGAAISGLQDVDWPKHVAVQVVAVPIHSSNAAVHGLETSEDVASDDAPRRIRVMLSNAADSSRESFALAWKTEADSDAPPADRAAASEFYVPPGQTRVVRAPPLASRYVTELILSGDDEPFDNRYWFVIPKRQRLRVLHLAVEAADDQQSLRYFLDRALGQAAADRVVDIETVDPRAATTRPPTVDDLADVPLVVLGARGELSKPWNDALSAWLDRGGVALAVLTHADDAAWRPLLPSELTNHEQIVVKEAEKSRDYVLLSELDRQHPLFAPFADPRYSDFTKIRFWHHRRISLDDEAAKAAHVLARFDSGDPALVEVPHGEGRLMLLASGWQPRESQLGVSSKFVPLLNTMVDLGWRRPAPATSYDTGATVDLAELSTSRTKPSASP